MWAQGRSQAEIDARMASAKLVARLRQVPLNVDAARKEVRYDQDTTRASCNAAVRSGRVIRLGEFQETRFDNHARSTSREPLRELADLVVGRWLPAAVGD